MKSIRNHQILTFGDKEYAVVPREEYETLALAYDEDETDIDTAQRVIEDPDEELVPFELAERIADGVHPVRVWREYRGMTAAELATRSGIAQSYLSNIETGRKPGSVKAMKRLADALGVSVDDLIQSA